MSIGIGRSWCDAYLDSKLPCTCLLSHETLAEHLPAVSLLDKVSETPPSSVPPGSRTQPTNAGTQLDCQNRGNFTDIPKVYLNSTFKKTVALENSTPGCFACIKLPFQSEYQQTPRGNRANPCIRPEFHKFLLKNCSKHPTFVCLGCVRSDTKPDPYT